MALPTRQPADLTREEQLAERRILAQSLRDEAQQFVQSGKSRKDALGEALKFARENQMGVAADVNEDQMRSFLIDALRTPAERIRNTQPDSGFAQQEQEARARSRASGAFGGPNTTATPSGGLTAAQTPRLAALEAMQSQPIGTTVALLRGTSPTGGTPIGKRSDMPSGGDIMREAFEREKRRRAREEAIGAASEEAFKRGSQIGTTFTAGGGGTSGLLPTGQPPYMVARPT